MIGILISLCFLLNIHSASSAADIPSQDLACVAITLYSENECTGTSTLQKFSTYTEPGHSECISVEDQPLGTLFTVNNQYCSLVGEPTFQQTMYLFDQQKDCTPFLGLDLFQINVLFQVDTCVLGRYKLVSCVAGSCDNTSLPNYGGNSTDISNATNLADSSNNETFANETDIVSSSDGNFTSNITGNETDMSASDTNATTCECVVKIGVNGETPDKQGNNMTLNGVNFWLNTPEFNITLNGKICRIEIISANNDDNKTVAVDQAKKLIQQGVVAIIGPEYSSMAIPVGQIANDAQTPMIATTATNPNVTFQRPFVFRVTFSDAEQGPAIASLTASEMTNITAAAIIYQSDDPYSNYLAQGIKGYWEYLNKTVAAYESFNETNIDNSDFADQAAAVAKLNNHSTALFIPVKGYEVPDIVKAVRNVGWNGQIIGADGWADELVLKDCGEACVGSFFTSNPIAQGNVGRAKQAYERYKKTYGDNPDAKAVLAFDAMSLIKIGLEHSGEWMCDIAQNRLNLRNGLHNITNFDGAGGKISRFDDNGNPINKCITIGKVGNDSKPVLIFNYCPGVF